MQKVSDEIVHFFLSQGFVIVSTIDEQGRPHNACKGIVDISSQGQVYLFDLYRGATCRNIKRNPVVSITAVDEHKFRGYTLKGKARAITDKDFDARLLKMWEDRITSRLTQRVLKNLGGEKGHPRHPEVLLPGPQYLIAMEVEEVVDLTPHHIKEKAKGV